MAGVTQPASERLTSPGVFGGQVSDANRVVISATNYIQTQDGAASPIISPVTVATNSVTTLVIPTNAISVTIAPKTNNVQVSEVVGTTSLSQYFEIPAGSTITLQIAHQSAIYLLGVTGSSVVSFIFATL